MRIQINDDNFVYDEGCFEYNDNLFSGTLYDVYENKQLRFEKTVENGLLHGVCKEWYATGQLKSIEYYERDTKQNTWQKWYESGQLASTERFYYSNLLEGTYWNKNGTTTKHIQAEMEQNFASTIVFTKIWFETGELKEQIIEEYGVILEKKEWTKNGNLITDYRDSF